MTVETLVRVREGIVDAQCKLDIRTTTGTLVMTAHSGSLSRDSVSLSDGDTMRWHIERLPLVSGRYFVNVRMNCPRTARFIDDFRCAAVFEILAEICESGRPDIAVGGLLQVPISLEIRPKK
jgi:hypothetical protein